MGPKALKYESLEGKGNLCALKPAHRRRTKTSGAVNDLAAGATSEDDARAGSPGVADLGGSGFRLSGFRVQASVPTPAGFV